MAVLNKDPAIPAASKASLADPSANVKRGMKERFGLHKLKADGHGLVKAAVVPPVHLLQFDDSFRNTWIDYSALDAKVWDVGVGVGRCVSRKGGGLRMYSVCRRPCLRGVQQAGHRSMMHPHAPSYCC